MNTFIDYIHITCFEFFVPPLKSGTMKKAAKELRRSSSTPMKIDEADTLCVDLREDSELEHNMMIKDHEFRHARS